MAKEEGGGRKTASSPILSMIPSDTHSASQTSDAAIIIPLLLSTYEDAEKKVFSLLSGELVNRMEDFNERRMMEKNCL